MNPLFKVKTVDHPGLAAGPSFEEIPDLCEICMIMIRRKKQERKSQKSK